MKWFFSLAPLLVAACGALPSDTDGTLNGVQARHRVRVGMVSPALRDRNPADKLVAEIAAASGADPVITDGDVETLLAVLDRGQIDVVIAPFARDTPWKEKVTLAPPVAQLHGGKTPIYLRAAVRNGENRWAMLVEHASRQTAPNLTDAG